MAKRFEARRKKESAATDLAAELAARGIAVVDDAQGMAMVCNLNKIAQLPEDLPDGCVAMRHSIPGFFMILAPAPEEEPPAPEQVEEDSARAEAEAMAELYAEGTGNRRAWLAEQLAAQSLLPNLSRLVAESDNRHAPLVKTFLEATGTKRLNVGHSEIVLLFESMNDAPGCGILDGTGKPRPKACERYIALMDAMEADGYEPDEDEQAIYQKATDCMEATK